MEDSCLQHHPQPKVAAASGISIFLLEELGDARLRCAQLKKYLDEASELIDKSEARDHFFEVAGHLLHGIPDTLLRMDKALSAAAMAAAKLDYEETKDDLRPEKVDELERALEEVRVRRVKRRSKEARSFDGLMMGKALEAFRTVVLPHLQHETKEALDQAVADAMIEFARMRAGNRSSFSGKLDRFKPTPEMDESEWIDQVEESMEMWFSTMKKTLSIKNAAENTLMKIPEAVAQLEHLAADIEAKGSVDSSVLASLIVQLEGPSTKTASSTQEIASVLRALSASLLDASDPAQRPSRLVLAATLRRVLGDTMNLKTAAGFGPVKIRNRDHGSGVSGDDFMTALKQAADNYYACRGENRSVQQAVTDALTGRIARIGPLTGMPDPIIQRAERLKKTVYELDHAMGSVAQDLEVLARDMKKAKPEDERYDKSAAEAKTSDDDKQSRFEEGKPADPTKDMSPEDAKKWKQQTEEHKDEFKSAALKTAAAEVARQMAAAFKEGAKTKGSVREMKAAADALCKAAKEAAETPFQPSMIASAPLGTFSTLSDRIYDLAFEMGGASASAGKKTASEDEEKRSRFEEGKPADPTKEMSPEDAKKWKENTDEHKDNFKSASVWKVAGGPTQSNWKELNGIYIGESGSKTNWTWEGDNMAFFITEIEGPGMPLYQLRMGAEIDGHKTGRLKLRKPAQFKKKEDAIKAAAKWHKTIKDHNDHPDRAGGLDLTDDWQKDRG